MQGCRLRKSDKARPSKSLEATGCFGAPRLFPLRSLEVRRHPLLEIWAKGEGRASEGTWNKGPAMEGSSANIAFELRAEIPEGINPERKELPFSLTAEKGLDELGDEQRTGPE